MLLPVIMAGGSGTRLWPLSRTLYPKQFLSLASGNTMLQDTVARLHGMEHQPPVLICNEEHRFIVAEQLRQRNFNHSGIILEPVGRNTAPAIALAALHASAQGDDPLLLILAADHVIQNQGNFIQSVQKAVPLADAGKLVTFGIVPHAPEIGYGYIRQGNQVSDDAYQVAAFVEKPDLATAEQYLASREYYWNSGMFMFRASCYLSELEKHQPEILSACRQAMLDVHPDLDFIRLNESAFRACPDDSIDYAVMEKTLDAVVVPMDAQWSDVGSWSALWDVNSKDENGNVIRGDVLTVNTHNSYIYAQHKLVSSVGVDDLVIVETKDAVLVANKNQVQDVKAIVSQLKDASRSEYLQHREVYQPWGSHDSISDGQRFHVKKVTVKPGQKTATQIHYHRAEHWIIVSGTAKIRKGEQTFLVPENESTYIPIGVPHSLENPGKVSLELIEVRTGGYLEEDDVIRIEDGASGY